MTILDAVLAFAVVAGLLTLVPGLDTALVLRSSLTRTRSYAWATALGIATGAMVWGVAAAVGVSALLAASELAYRVLSTTGAAYMLWLGVSMIRTSLRAAPRDTGARAAGGTADADRGPATAEGVVVGRSAGAVAPSHGGPPWRGWLTGTGTNLLNPKVGVFYIATIPQFLPEGTSPLLMGAALAGVHCVLTMAWFTVLIVGGGYARRWLSSARALAVVDRVTGLVLLGFGGTLLADALAPPAPART
ncbi:LysE family translocator [Citricoccus sp. SGAir0253]|uniref:LysE family translocator n=1 Tax=Citricoccus sp. SGAir0253 TaxID=2567881 RepID=UPI0010CD1183|nr:LysE family translocator [Citricoccus sp. SGAir0253]QCU79165.1 LysE family translocator [Citricoccus sp. SGAir0253]